MLVNMLVLLANSAGRVYAGLGMSLSSVFVLGNATDLEKETKHSI